MKKVKGLHVLFSLVIKASSSHCSGTSFDSLKIAKMSISPPNWIDAALDVKLSYLV